MKNGFTLIELMITVFILAIVASLAVPSFTESIRNNRLISQSNGFIGAINYARSEAVKLGQNSVTLCSSSDSASCNGPTGWESGYLIFRDTDNDGAVDTGEEILRVGEPLSGGNTLRTRGFTNANFITFDNQGMIASTGSFTFCDSRGASEARGLVLNISGQSRVATDDDSNGTVDVVDTGSGSNATCP